ncbi:MAG TPA: dihydrofolate reductase [Anaerovoracaceae bacterium]|nr:dihydrofolate reductase [Anaerovoracaceae bacterium]
MKAIVVVDKNWGIGRDKKLLVHLPGDLKYFKEHTLGKTIVMGRETLESLPGGRPLPNRNNIVLTRNRGYRTDCTICHSKEELLKMVKDGNMDEVFIIGGEKIYEQFLSYCDTCYVTKIEKTLEADKFFHNLDKDENFSVVDESGVIEEDGTRYKFVEYRRK